MQPFFGKESDNQKKEWLCYLLFYVATSGGHLLFHSKNINIVTNLATLLLITGCYETRWQRRVLVTLLVYGCNIGADFLSLHLFTNYYVTKTVDDAVGYSTMMILLIEELLFEKFWIKIKIRKICLTSISLRLY